MSSASRSSNKLRAVLFASMLGLSAFAGSEARAEDTKEAMERFERGVSLYQAGAYEGALLEFEAAYKGSGNFRVLFNIGLCKMESRDPAGALLAFRRYLSEGGERVDATKRANVDALIKKLELSVASLTVKSDAPPGTEVRIDDERVGTLPLAAPLTVRTGRRKVSIVSGAQRTDKTIDVMSGESPSVELSLPTAQAPATTTPRADEPPKKDDSDGPGALWVPWAMAGAFGAAAVVTGVVAVGARNDAETARATFGAAQNDIDTPNKKATTFAAVTDALLGATVISAGIGTYFTIRWLSRPSPSEKSAKATGRPSKVGDSTAVRKVELVPAGAGIRLQGEFDRAPSVGSEPRDDRHARVRKRRLCGENPVVEVGREAGASVPPAPEVPGDLPPSDTADCSTCNEILTSSLRNAACRGNAKPSSAEVLGAYVDCVCKGECAETCALHCGGAPRDTACATCAAEKCAEADKKCREDVKR